MKVNFFATLRYIAGGKVVEFLWNMALQLRNFLMPL